MSYQFILIVPSQFLPNRVGPFPLTTINGKVSDCPSYCTFTSLEPTTGRGSLEYVCNLMSEATSFFVGHTFLKVPSDIIDMDALVSISIGILHSSTCTHTLRGGSLPPDYFTA